jgi:hypothetical protein
MSTLGVWGQQSKKKSQDPCVCLNVVLGGQKDGRGATHSAKSVANAVECCDNPHYLRVFFGAHTHDISS